MMAISHSPYKLNKLSTHPLFLFLYNEAILFVLKLSNTVGKLKDILPQSMLFQVYKALVESHFRYDDVVWGSLSNTKITALQRLQNRAFEIIQASKIKDSWIRPTFSIEQIFQFDRSVQMFKIINKICPESLHG